MTDTRKIVMDKRCNLLFALAVFIILHDHTSLAILPNISTDEAALLALKSHIYCHPNILTRNWSSSSPICSWIGITCSSRHQPVTGLDISSMQLHGTIPPHLGNLSFLVSLNISYNAFHGYMPLELAHLQRLQSISITSNNFTGPIPAFLSLLTKLRDEQSDAKMQCLCSIMELALSSTLVTPDARISMKDALSTLGKIRLQLVSSRH